MNNKGTILISVMLGVLLFVAVMIFINPISDVVTEVRGASQLDCDNESISDGHKGACLINDLSLPMYIMAGMGVALAVIGARIVMG